MKSLFAILITFLFCMAHIHAQNIVKTILPNDLSTQQWILENPHPQAEPFTALSAAVFGGQNMVFQYAESEDGERFSALSVWTWDSHFDGENVGNAHKNVLNLVILHPKTRFVKIVLAGGDADFLRPSRIDLHFFNPDSSKSDVAPVGDTQLAADQDAFCNCPQPAFRTRSQWCTTGSCAPTSAPLTTVAGHVVVHHSAGTNVSTNWDAIVTAVWSAHVNTNGWSDIGYNWLIAPNGMLYQGRGDGILGAHFCGNNAGTLGICMVGTYTNQSITAAAQSKLVEMLAFECCKNNIDPLGTALHASSGLVIPKVCGHRDGCSTECPGTSFYATLPLVRDSAGATLGACSASTNTESLIGTNHQLTVFPNPATLGGMVYFTLPNGYSGNVNCRVYTTTGQLLAHYELSSGENAIQLPQNVASPMLIVHLDYEHVTYAGRVMLR